MPPGEYCRNYSIGETVGHKMLWCHFAYNFCPNNPEPVPMALVGFVSVDENSNSLILRQ